MKILNQSEISNYQTKYSVAGKGRAQCMIDLLNLANTLEIGGVVMVAKNEWTNRTPPYITKQLGSKVFRIKTLIDESGWLVVRMK